MYKQDFALNYQQGLISCWRQPTRVVVPVRIHCMGQIDLFRNYLYLIGPFSIKPLMKQLYKKENMNVIP